MVSGVVAVDDVVMVADGVEIEGDVSEVAEEYGVEVISVDDKVSETEVDMTEVVVDDDGANVDAAVVEEIETGGAVSEDDA